MRSENHSRAEEMRAQANQAMCKCLMAKNVRVFSLPYRIKNNIIGLRCWFSAADGEIDKHKDRQSDRQAEGEIDRSNPIFDVILTVHRR